MDKQLDYRSYDYFKYSILKYQEGKLFDDNLENQHIDNSISLSNEERKEFILKYKGEYDKKLNEVNKYKLKKDIQDENTPQEHKNDEIPSQRLERITISQRKETALTILLLKKTGKLYKPFLDAYIEGNVFYEKKDKRLRLEPSNSRCLVSCDNRLKMLTRYLKDNVFEDVFLSGKVNTNINRVKKCYITYENHQGQTVRKLHFESVSNIACTIHKTNSKFMLLDLSNAYNNVYYTILYEVLNHYLDDETFSEGITNLIRNIKYYDPKLKLRIKRNKGIPQGCASSTDIFVLCMDYISKQIIAELKEQLDLKYNVDYKMIIYVDDILILFKTPRAENLSMDIFKIFETLFNKYKFILNGKKSKCSPGLPNCSLDVIKDSDKYLGVYFTKDLDTYLTYLDEEIKIKSLLNGKITSLNDCETYFDELTTKNKMYLIGKLRYRLSPFVKDNITMSQVLQRYNNISKLFSV
jgi:hypothetical protein